MGPRRIQETFHPAFYLLMVLGLFLMSVAAAGPVPPALTEEATTPVMAQGVGPSRWVPRAAEASSPEQWAYVTGSELTVDEELEEPPEGADLVLPTLIVHTIVVGDTLWDLAVQHHTSIETISRLNDLKNLHQLRLGDNLLILTNAIGTLHRVAEGETVAAIAQRHEVDVQVILSANDLEADAALTVGQPLIIPTGPARTPMETRIAARSSGGFIWPLRGRITSAFGWRWGRLHQGIDIAARTGDPIVAARDGRVTFAGWNGGYGNLIIISHGAGVETRYAHLSRMEVSVGQHISTGQRIGRAGSTGFSTGPHLHFEIRVNGNPVNPRLHLP